MAIVRGLEPIVGDAATVLVLGTMPGKASLATEQYYSHPRNTFWRLTEAILGISAMLPYSERVAHLRAANVALWDVLKHCERESSLDADIVAPVANDFAAFYAAHPAIGRVYFNGEKAERLYNRHVLTMIDPGRPVLFMRLPSTSPANTAGFTVKLAQWKTIGS